MMKIIADSGSTKTDWTLLSEGGEVLATCHSQGLNPYHLSEEEIVSVLRDEVKKAFLPDGCFHEKLEIFFYGSGVTDAMIPKMERLLVGAFAEESQETPAEGLADVQAHAASDMLGAARALLGHEAGIAVILGTGSNSCFYDGKRMQQGVPPLGYILGDEGSGTAIGKAFLRLILRHPKASTLKEEFFAWSGMDYAGLIDRIYRQPLANTYLASISAFVGEKLKKLEEKLANETQVNETLSKDAQVDEAKVQYELLAEMVKQVYLDFCHQILSHYEKGTVGFVGSIAFYFQKYIAAALQESGFTMGSVLRSPMDGLVCYHS